MPPTCIRMLIAYVIIDLAIIWSVMDTSSKCSRGEEELWKELESRRDNSRS